MRRKSVDLGGLALALAGGHGCGSGWGGWDEDDISEAMYEFSLPRISPRRPNDTANTLLQICRVSERHVHPDPEHCQLPPGYLVSLHLHCIRQHGLTISLPSTFPTILDETRIQAIETLDSWNFEPSKLPEEGVLVCTIILFEALLCREGMEDETNITLGTSLSYPHLTINR